MKPVLSPKELAQAIGVSESSLKRWADDGQIRVSRTAGGHRRIPIAEAIRFVRESRAVLVHPEILGLPDIGVVTAERGVSLREHDRLVDFLKDGRASDARGMILALYLAGESVAAIFDGPIREAFRRLGELWRHDQAGIFIEHRATDICIQAVHQLRLTLPPTDGAPVAIGAAPPKDAYVLPSLAAATVLQAEGYQTINLGPDTPFDTLLHAAREHKPPLVWLSVTSEADGRALTADVRGLAGELRALGARLAVGGQRRALVELEPDGDVFDGATMSELAAFAKGLLVAQARSN